MKRFLGHPLVRAVIVTCITIAVYRSVTPDQNERYLVPTVMMGLSIMSLIVAYSIGIQTKRWSTFTAGLLEVFIADCVWWFSFYKTSQQSPWFVEHVNDILILVEALFSVGLVFVLVGLAQEWWMERKERNDTSNSKVA
jgi:heme A synthase